MFPLALQKGVCRHIHSEYILLVLRVTIKRKHIYPRAVFRRKKNDWGANTCRVVEGQSGTYISLNTTYRDTGPYLGGGGGGGRGLKRKIFFSIDNATQQLQLMDLFLACFSFSRTLPAMSNMHAHTLQKAAYITIACTL